MLMAVIRLATLAALHWTASAPLPQGVDHHATFVTTGRHGSILHVLGGNNYQAQFANHWSAAIQRDGSLAPWHEEAPFPTPVLGHTVLIVGQTAVAIAGQHTGRQNTGEVFTAAVDREGALGPWTPAEPLPAARFHAASVTNGRDLYVLGGLETTTSTGTVFRARVARDGSLGTWQPLDTLPHPRSHQAAFIARGRIYQVGGLNGNPAGANTPLGDVISAEIHRDGSLGPWTTVSTLDSAYGTHAAFVHGGYVHVAGGVENNRRFTDIVQRAELRRDGSLGPWEPCEPLPQARGHVHHLPVVGDFVYSVGGSRGRQVIADVFIGSLR